SMRQILRSSLIVPTTWLVLVAAPRPALAQAHDTTESRLSTAARSAVETYNSSATTRVIGAFDVPSSKVITGDVAVLNGPVTIGGGIAGKDSAHIGGEIFQQPELLRYRLDGARLVADREPEYDDTWWRRHNVRD